MTTTITNPLGTTVILLLLLFSLTTVSSLLTNTFILHPLKKQNIIQSKSSSSITTATTSNNSINNHHHPYQEQGCYSFIISLKSSSRYDNDNDNDNDSWDTEDDYKEFEKSLKNDPDFEEYDFDLKDLGIKGILDDSEQIMSLEDISAIKTEATDAINKIFDKRLDDIETLRENFQKDAIETKKRMNDASDARAAQAKTKLLNKIDSFLKETSTSRMTTKLAVEADSNMVGKGLTFGSWGINESGEEVMTETSSGSTSLFASSQDLDNGNVSTSSSSSSTTTRIVIIVDESKDKNDIKVARELCDKLSSSDEANNNNVICDIVTPLQCKTGGGDYAKVAILFSSTYFDRDSLELTLDKLLKRTSTSGGSLPPTHLVLISSLGTTRTNKMPYSMQNLLGNKLSKKQSIEEGLITRCKQGLMGGTIPLDYTIIKWGNIIQESKKNALGSEASPFPIELSYGDTLDGDILLKDATNILYQTIALQKYAHNTTFSVISSSSAGSKGEDTSSILEQTQWDDIFLKLNGPELKRTILMENASIEEVQKKYELLCEYLQGWAEGFADAKKSGLSTPVTVHKTSLNKVEIRFKSTNTGSSYKSAKEERTIEQESRRTPTTSSSKSSSASSSTSSSPNVVGKQKKEGGIEVVVEIVNNEGTTATLRVRAKRCNMQPDGSTIIKEMSESTILNKLSDALKYWKTQET